VRTPFSFRALALFFFCLSSSLGLFVLRHTVMVALLGMGPDKNLFLAHILKYINDMAFKLDASVPLARRGLFGFSGRKELWVFKGSESWWSANRK